MASRELILWIDERWYQALNKQLRNMTVEEALEEKLDAMIDELVPNPECSRISREIWLEQQAARQEQEAERRFSVYHITESGKDERFLIEGTLDMLVVAKTLRPYLNKDPRAPPACLAEAFPCRTMISEKEFDAYVMERLEKPTRVLGAYDINLDKREFATLHTRHGWETYRIKDVSTAVYFASKKEIESWSNRWVRFMEKLVDKRVPNTADCTWLHGERRLTAEDISFSDEVMQNDFMLEFYMDVSFDADRVFGTHVGTTENDSYLNLYANYNLEEGWVDDELTVILVRDDGGDVELRYKLSAEEKAAMLPKMDAHCKQKLGLSLDQCREQYFGEQVDSPEIEPQM